MPVVRQGLQSPMLAMEGSQAPTPGADTTTMLPKGKLAGLIAIFAAIGLITATGAFTTVTAERTATVTTAGDADALLALNPTNANYASIPSSGANAGQLVISVDGTFNSQGATGVNLNALTEINNVFSITNQGTQQIEVWISVNATSGNENVVTFHGGDTVSASPLDDTNKVTLGTGDSTNVSMSIDTRGASLNEDDNIITGITVHANATA